MDIQTIFGITWRVPTTGEIILFCGIILTPLALVFFIRLYRYYRKRRLHESQVFLFHLKRLGLSNFQIKIINNLVETLHLSNPNTLFSNPSLFESAVGRFLSHAQSAGEGEDSLYSMCRDITTMHHKLYHQHAAAHPLQKIEQIDEHQLICFTPAPGRVMLGRIVSHDPKHIYLKVLNPIRDLQHVPEARDVVFRFYHIGDAEYEFTSRIVGKEGERLRVLMPGSLMRRSELRHPYIDVMIPATLTPLVEEAPAATSKHDEEATDRTGGDTQEAIPCTIHKLNEYEAVVRSERKIDYRSRYMLEFTEMDFRFNITTAVITSRNIEESGSLYCTLRFEHISPAAARVLKTYVYQHL